MPDVVWESPLPVDKWTSIAEELRSRPDTWARLDDAGANPRAVSTQIKRGLLKAFRPVGAFEAKMAEGKLWARYVGDRS